MIVRSCLLHFLTFASSPNDLLDLCYFSIVRGCEGGWSSGCACTCTCTSTCTYTYICAFTCTYT